MRRLLALVLILPLIACETSAVWYATHPDKRMVVIDGKELNVVPRGGNKYDVWGGTEWTKTNMVVLKKRQIQAVETVTGCKVDGAEYYPGGLLLQTIVSC